MLWASHALKEKFTWERTFVLKEQKIKIKMRDQSLFIAWGVREGGGEGAGF